MPFRLQIVHGERTLRIPLTEGEWSVGSAPDADIRISHPTVSRRHARLFVGAGGVDVEDLGSSNGTRVDGDAVRGRTVLPPGKPLLFGTAVALLESLEVQDSEVGIAMGGAAGGREDSEAVQSPKPMATLAPSVLEHFTKEFLPEVLEVMAEGAPPLDRIQAIGNGLFTSLPCRSVEISQDCDGDEAVVFVAERKRRRDDSAEAAPVMVSSEGWVVRVLFPVENLARAYEPLVRSGALLAGLAVGGGEQDSKAVRSRPNAPALPTPTTVSATVQKVYSSAARVAAGPISVLIHGESGTGKELLARYIHAASPRANAPLVTLNCAALSRDLLEAELFGVEKGVATGVESRKGRFEQAHGGTLFLDEIGDMAQDTQAKILRVLQENEVFRVGSGSPRPADVRVVSATNRDLDSMLESGAFRPDLYHRIADWVVELPALRHRRDDIPNLAVHFLAAACDEAGTAPAGISKAAVSVLSSANWPGNIRQLEREMSRVALFLEDGDLLDTSLLQGSLFDGAEVQDRDESLKCLLEDAERRAIEAALTAANGDVGEAAKRLKIGRSTLYRRMTALGISD
ncbi:MAG: sigma 54-interacting transcriptional regulator [Acidobacteriota bacterium]